MILDAVGPRLSFAAWAPMERNQWIAESLEVVRPLLKAPLPTPAPDAPGAFAFSDPERVQRILNAAGWRDVECELWEGPLGLPAKMPEETPEEIARFLSAIGPAGRIATKQGVDPDAVVNALAERYRANLERDGELVVQGASWIVTARG